MKTRWYPLALLAWFVILALTMTGCAATSSTSASGKSQRDLLLAAGFRKDVADQPGEIKHFQKLPPEKLLCYQRGNEKCYTLKDPVTNSMYIGDEAAFRRYLDLVIQERLDKSYQQYRLQEDDPEFWKLWVDKQGGG
jgi:hypothetical protein